MPPKTLYRFILSLALLAYSSQSSSTQYQSRDEIAAAAKRHLVESTMQFSGRTEIDITPLDKRLRLVRCDDPLETFSPAGASTRGKTTVGVRCGSPRPWTLYVSATIGFTGPVVVAKRDLSRGSAIAPGDIELVERKTNHLLRGYFDTLSQVEGRTLKRALRRNQVVTPSMLALQKTVQRGQRISILAGSAGIEVRMHGKALKDGNPGDLIQVQNLASKKRLEARVIDTSTVRID